MRAVTFRTLVVALSFVALACGPQAPAGTDRGTEPRERAAPQRIVGAIKGDPFTLNSMMSNLGGTGGVRGIDEVEQLVSAAMAQEDNQGKLQPVLADAVPSVENG